jgi:hypothetical protein
MADKKKITAAIISAVTTYIQMEPKSPPVAPGVKPEQKTSGGK